MIPRAHTAAAIAGSLLAVAALLPPASRGEDAPSAAEFDANLPEGGSLSGREIYERFLENEFRKSFQHMRVVSRDPGGGEQSTTFLLSVEDLRDAGEPDVYGVQARMLLEVTAPFDMRHTRYLMIAKDPGPDDEFVYQPSARRVRRVDLKRTPLLGTDYTFGDVAYYDLEDARYVRHPDSEIDGIPVYVIEAFVRDTREVEYHRTVSYLEQAHYVPLRIRYWDDHGVQVKELNAPHSGIRAFGEKWVATLSTMRDLLQNTSSTLYVDHVDTNPAFSPHFFTVARLNQGH